MSRSPPFTPPSSPSRKTIPSALSFQAVNPFSTPSANSLADSLGVSPRYRRNDSARWHGAAHVYQSSRTHSRAHSPTSENLNEPFPDSSSGQFTSLYNSFGTPLSLEEIGRANRKRHAETGGALNEVSTGGPLELEAIATVHELSSEVRSIAVSEILPRTADLIFVNIKTVEGHPFTLELTMKGWRIASLQCDSMNGDYKQVHLHIKYYENARELLEQISPAHSQYFTRRLTEKLNELHKWKKAQEEREAISAYKSEKKVKNKGGNEDADDGSSDEGLVFITSKSRDCAENKLGEKD